MFRTCVTAVTLLALAGWAVLAAAEPDAKEGWIQLFNGKNLTGWTPKIKGHDLGENFGNTFRVEAGILKVSYDQYQNFDGQFGHLFYKEPFSSYILRLEYRFTGEQCPGGPSWAIRNSGAMIHGESAETMDKDQEFPASIEVQLLGGNGTQERTTANLCTPGTNVVMNGKLITQHCTNSKSKTYHGDQWVTVEIEVRGNKTIKHLIDGKVVLEYEQPQLDERDAHAKQLAAKRGGIQLDGGTISLQSESHPVEFRRVELKKLAD
jgi:3-keto-disaccharide hydrolase